MTKLKFLMSLHQRLLELPQNEVEERLGFYSEMIEDRMEEGLSEEDAVAAVGTVEEIAAQIQAELSPEKSAPVTPLPVKKSKKWKTWEIVLLALGSPIWASLLIAAASVIFSLCVVLWSLIIPLWAVFVSLTACAPTGIAAGIGYLIAGNRFFGLLFISMGLVCAGLAIFAFFVCHAATKGIVRLSKKCFIAIKKLFTQKEEV